MYMDLKSFSPDVMTYVSFCATCLAQRCFLLTVVAAHFLVAAVTTVTLETCRAKDRLLASSMPSSEDISLSERDLCERTKIMSSPTVGCVDANELKQTMDITKLDVGR